MIYVTSTCPEPVQPLTAPKVDVLHDLAVHDIYLSRHLIGMDPIWVIAHGERYIQSPYNNVINILLGFPNGKIASIFASFIHRSKNQENDTGCIENKIGI